MRITELFRNFQRMQKLWFSQSSSFHICFRPPSKENTGTKSWVSFHPRSFLLDCLHLGTLEVDVGGTFVLWAFNSSSWHHEALSLKLRKKVLPHMVLKLAPWCLWLNFFFQYVAWVPVLAQNQSVRGSKVLNGNCIAKTWISSKNGKTFYIHISTWTNLGNCIR